MLSPPIVPPDDGERPGRHVPVREPCVLTVAIAPHDDGLGAVARVLVHMMDENEAEMSRPQILGASSAAALPFLFPGKSEGSVPREPTPSRAATAPDDHRNKEN